MTNDSVTHEPFSPVSFTTKCLFVCFISAVLCGSPAAAPLAPRCKSSQKPTKADNIFASWLKHIWQQCNAIPLTQQTPPPQGKRSRFHMMPTNRVAPQRARLHNSLPWSLRIPEIHAKSPRTRRSCHPINVLTAKSMDTSHCG